MDKNKTFIIVIDPEHADILIEILKQQCEQEYVEGIATEVIDGSLILNSENPNQREFIKSIYHSDSTDEITVEHGKKFIKIKFCDIIFLIGYKTFTKIHLKDNRVVTDNRHLIDIIQQFPINIFRISKRGTLLNTDYIEEYHRGNGRSGYFDMIGGNKIIIATRRKIDFEDIILLLKEKIKY